MVIEGAKICSQTGSGNLWIPKGMEKGKDFNPSFLQCGKEGLKSRPDSPFIFAELILLKERDNSKAVAAPWTCSDIKDRLISDALWTSELPVALRQLKAGFKNPLTRAQSEMQS